MVQGGKAGILKPQARAAGLERRVPRVSVSNSGPRPPPRRLSPLTTMAQAEPDRSPASHSMGVGSVMGPVPLGTGPFL